MPGLSPMGRRLRRSRPRSSQCKGHEHGCGFLNLCRPGIRKPGFWGWRALWAEEWPLSLTHRWACPFLCLGLWGLICKMTLEQAISGAPPSRPKSPSASLGLRGGR